MLWLPALVPILFALVTLALRPHRRGVLACIATLAMLSTLVVVAWAAAQGGAARLPWTATLALHAEMTPLSTLVAALVPVIALPVLVYAALRESETGLARLIGLLLLFTGAMEWLVIASDLLTLLIGWELVGACSWALIAHDWRDAANPRSAQFAFVATRLGDLGLFIAALAAYGGVGSFAYADLGRLDALHLGLVAGGVTLAAASKSGQVPFSPWLFRAMAGPASASALLHAATMVAAGAYVLGRLQPTLHAVPWFDAVLLTIGSVTALSAGVVALVQPHVKKLLAASTSAHFGLMFVAIGAGFPGVAMLHLVAHGIFKALLFLAAGVAIAASGSHDLNAMRIGRALPAVAVLAAIAGASLAGVPPLGAGWTKDAIASAAATAGWGWAAAVIVAGGLSAAYAVRWCLMAYGWGDKQADEMPATPGVVLAALGWLALASVALSLLWLPVLREHLAAALTITLPDESFVLVGSALVAITIGALSGRWLAARAPDLGHAGAAAQVADWWGIPMLIDSVIVQPSHALARAAAAFDDRFLDAGARGVRHGGPWVAMWLGKLDQRVVDRRVRVCSDFVQVLARMGSRIGESVADGVALLPSRLVGISGEDARRLQTGLSHHAFAVLLIGAVLLGGLLFAAAR